MLGRILIVVFLALNVFYSSSNADAQGLTESEAQAQALPQLSGFEELLLEAQGELSAGRPIDARAKLLQAVKLKPEDYRSYLLLGQYYLLEVSSFKLAYRYLKTADSKFTKEFGKDDNIDARYQNRHAMLLYMLSEAELNLDKYEDSLKTLDRFEKNYWMEFYPGTRAWLLMKLKRVDEAIQIAQEGIRRNADPRRTWNILGILLSVKGKRELSLEAFKEAIIAELARGGSAYISTPLNNAGEVYREMFRDGLAEGAWLKSVKLPDGCDHILPSLNLANMYMDQLRLYQAERSLKDFEACFREKSDKKDSEHRTLLALARGKIALLENEIDKSTENLEIASQDQQWFGKIGTNENDVTLASYIALSQSFSAKAAALKDSYSSSIFGSLKTRLRSYVYSFRAWWLMRQARKIALEELDDFEDLFIRNTDSMLQYPTLGAMIAGMNSASTKSRMKRMIASDTRKPAALYYRLYAASNAGYGKDVIAELKSLLNQWSPIERLAKSETLARLLMAEQKTSWFWQSNDQTQNLEELFELLPSYIRRYDFRLPAQVSISSTNNESKKYLKKAASFLFSTRFKKANSAKARFRVALGSPAANTLSIELFDTKNQRLLAQHTQVFKDEINLELLINPFISKAFSYRLDAPQNFIPQLPILQGL